MKENLRAILGNHAGIPEVLLNVLRSAGGLDNVLGLEHLALGDLAHLGIDHSGRGTSGDVAPRALGGRSELAVHLMVGFVVPVFLGLRHRGDRFLGSQAPGLGLVGLIVIRDGVIVVLVISIDGPGCLGHSRLLGKDHRVLVLPAFLGLGSLLHWKIVVGGGRRGLRGRDGDGGHGGGAGSSFLGCFLQFMKRLQFISKDQVVALGLGVVGGGGVESRQRFSGRVDRLGVGNVVQQALEPRHGHGPLGRLGQHRRLLVHRDRLLQELAHGLSLQSRIIATGTKRILGVAQIPKGSATSPIVDSVMHHQVQRRSGLVALMQGLGGRHGEGRHVLVPTDADTLGLERS